MCGGLTQPLRLHVISQQKQSHHCQLLLWYIKLDLIGMIFFFLTIMSFRSFIIQDILIYPSTSTQEATR